MSILNEHELDNNLHVAIAFHFPQEYSEGTARDKIEGILETVFKDSNKFKTILKTEGNSYSEENDELIYLIEKPTMASDKESESFFQKLKVVFQTAEDMMPHFTQLAGKI